MTAEEIANAATERLAGRLLPAVDRFVEEIAADVRERISVPVGYAGRRVIRSKPGEPPRKEFDVYRTSWTFRTARDGDTIRGAAGTPMPRGVWLEEGTSRMEARPHVEPAFNAARGEAVDRIKSNL